MLNAIMHVFVVNEAFAAPQALLPLAEGLVILLFAHLDTDPTHIRALD